MQLHSRPVTRQVLPWLRFAGAVVERATFAGDRIARSARRERRLKVECDIVHSTGEASFEVLVKGGATVASGTMPRGSFAVSVMASAGMAGTTSATIVGAEVRGCAADSHLQSATQVANFLLIGQQIPATRRQHRRILAALHAAIATEGPALRAYGGRVYAGRHVLASRRLERWEGAEWEGSGGGLTSRIAGALHRLGYGEPMRTVHGVFPDRAAAAAALQPLREMERRGAIRRAFAALGGARSGEEHLWDYARMDVRSVLR